MNDRENEIYRQGAEEVKNTYAFIHDEEFSCGDMADMFLKGALYADQHPRKGLWDTQKVTEWLENHVREFKYYDSDCSDGNIDIEGLIETLTKAMEE